MLREINFHSSSELAHMVPTFCAGAPSLDVTEAIPRQAFHAPEQLSHRPTTGSRKRKAYMPRNSGCDNVSSEAMEQLTTKKRVTGSRVPKCPTKHAAAGDVHNAATAVGAPLLRVAAQSTDSPPSSPAAASCKARSMSPRAPEAQACGSGSSSAAAPASAPGQVAVESLATTRSRRVIKRREKFDPHMFELSGDLDEAEETRSDNSSETLSRRCYNKAEPDMGALARQPTSDSAAACGGVPSPRAWLSALVSGMPKPGGHRTESATGTSDEQRMFQEFRKRTCTAYTGVVVHCQNMKLEARVNMVSYFPQRERKISGGQIYIAYMTNPHQAAVVHDITASIMTAPGIPIYHNHHCRPSTNTEVALERLNYLDTLDVNMHRGYSRNNDKDQLLEKKAKLDAENRRQVMLSPEALKRELHCWVSHDSRWLTFKSWIEDVLFESKLANMCLKPKTIDNDYLKPEEQELLNHWAPEFSMVNPHVFTHMYDTLIMDRVLDSSGNLCGYKLRSKRYRRRKPEVRNGAVKWFDDKSYRCDLEDAPTEEDQRRVDIAWGVVCRWLRHYDPALQGPPPDYDAVDANYYVTWGHFADWVNTLLEHMPHEIEAMQKEAASGTPERSTSTRRSARNGDGQALKERIKRIQAVHDKFRSVVAEGESMPSTWSQAKPEHRRAFENFFSGWKPLPPSMSQLQRRALTRGASDCGYRSSRRTANARNDTAPQTRSAGGASKGQGVCERYTNGSAIPAGSAFTNVSAAATNGTSCTHISGVDVHATPTSPAIPPESGNARPGDATAALLAATTVSSAMQQNRLSQTVALPQPLLPWTSQPPQHASFQSALPVLSKPEPSAHTSIPLSTTPAQPNANSQQPRLTVASLTGIMSGTQQAAVGPTGASAADQSQSLPQQKLKVATGVIASMAGINDVAGLHAWATMHGLSSAVPTILNGTAALNPAGVQSAATEASAAPASLGTTAAQGLSGLAASQQPVQICDLQQLMQLRAQLQTSQAHTGVPVSVAQHRPQDNTQQQQISSGRLNEAIAALKLPSALFGAHTHFSSQAPNASAPSATLAPAGSTQAPPRPVALPPSPFLAVVENPAKLATAESLFQGAPAVPPLVNCSLNEPAHSGMNDSARSCLTGSTGAPTQAAGGPGVSCKPNTNSNAVRSAVGSAQAEGSTGATAITETAVHHPTLSHLLSNPLFALPSSRQASRAGGNNAN